MAFTLLALNPIAPPDDGSPRFRASWERADRIARTCTDASELLMDGPRGSDEETYNGFIGALAAHRDALAVSAGKRP